MKKATDFKVILGIESILKDRLRTMPEGSYSTMLFDAGLNKILDKLGEEVSELMVAVVRGHSKDVIYEAADTCFHLVVFVTYMKMDMEGILPLAEEIEEEIEVNSTEQSVLQEKLLSLISHNCAMLIFLSDEKRRDRAEELSHHAKQLFINIILLCLTRDIDFVKIASELKSRMKLQIVREDGPKAVIH